MKPYFLLSFVERDSLIVEAVIKCSRHHLWMLNRLSEMIGEVEAAVLHARIRRFGQVHWRLAVCVLCVYVAPYRHQIAMNKEKKRSADKRGERHRGYEGG